MTIALRHIHPLLPELCALGEQASQAIMQYHASRPEARAKADRSPVTDADMAAHDVLCAGLARLTPEIPVISEEDKENPDIARAKRFWLVDPLDGTRDFVGGGNDFSVNIGLVEGKHPALGVIALPVRRLLYAGIGKIAVRLAFEGEPEAIHARPPPKEGLTVTRSRSHPSKQTEAYLAALPIRELIPASSAIKFCWLAEGAADIYPRFGRTMEWDTAAGQAILEAAGGRVETAEGAPFTYGKPSFENPHFVAFGAISDVTMKEER